MANLATNFQDLVAKVKNLGALAPVLGAISRPGELNTGSLLRLERVKERLRAGKESIPKLSHAKC